MRSSRAWRKSARSRLFRAPRPRILPIAPKNLPEIARQLGVANILQGSVQRAGDSVRVNVQLIRAATDDHVWAESYDRKLDDIFGVENEVAQNIASALNARLTGAKRRLLPKGRRTMRGPMQLICEEARNCGVLTNNHYSTRRNPTNKPCVRPAVRARLGCSGEGSVDSLLRE